MPVTCDVGDGVGDGVGDVVGDGVGDVHPVTKDEL